MRMHRLCRHARAPRGLCTGGRALCGLRRIHRRYEAHSARGGGTRRRRRGAWPGGLPRARWRRLCRAGRLDDARRERQAVAPRRCRLGGSWRWHVHARLWDWGWRLGSHGGGAGRPARRAHVQRCRRARCRAGLARLWRRMEEERKRPLRGAIFTAVPYTVRRAAGRRRAVTRRGRTARDGRLCPGRRWCSGLGAAAGARRRMGVHKAIRCRARLDSRRGLHRACTTVRPSLSQGAPHQYHHHVSQCILHNVAVTCYSQTAK